MGFEALQADAYGPFKEKLIENLEKGWEHLMEYDDHSVRTYLGQVKGYPFGVITWMETMDGATLSYGQALSEV